VVLLALLVLWLPVCNYDNATITPTPLLTLVPGFPGGPLTPNSPFSPLGPGTPADPIGPISPSGPYSYK